MPPDACRPIIRFPAAARRRACDGGAIRGRCRVTEQMLSGGRRAAGRLPGPRPAPLKRSATPTTWAGSTNRIAASPTRGLWVRGPVPFFLLDFFWSAATVDRRERLLSAQFVNAPGCCSASCCCCRFGVGWLADQTALAERCVSVRPDSGSAVHLSQGCGTFCTGALARSSVRAP
jgi:hypothetical protein